MKKTIKLLTLLSCVLLTVVLSGCSLLLNGLFGEESRAVEIIDKANANVDDDRYHYQVTESVVSYSEGQSYVSEGAYEEIYDASDASNLKYLYSESKNILGEIPQTYCYVDGVAYVSTQHQRLRCEMTEEEFWYYMPGIAFHSQEDIEEYATLSCEEVDGKQIVTYEYTDGRLLDRVFGDLAWALSGYDPKGMRLAEYREECVVNDSFQYEEFRTYMKILSVNREDEYVELFCTQRVIYDDFEITAPTDAELYADAEDLLVLQEMVDAMNLFLGEAQGAFEIELLYKFSGAYDDAFANREQMIFRTDEEGLLNFEWTSTYLDSEYESQSVITYDGVTATVTQNGSRTQSPLSQSDAYVTVQVYKDYLWLTRTCVAEYEAKRSVDGSVTLDFTATRDLTDTIASEELTYFEVDFDPSSLETEGECRIVFSAGETVEKVEFLLTASFLWEGIPSTLHFTYTMTATAH